MLVKVELFIFLADFDILDCEVDFKVPIIIVRLFLATCRSLVDMQNGKMKFRLNSKEVTFNICWPMRHNGGLQSIYAISYKENIKKYQDLKIEIREFMVWDMVLI